jgi:hypothetical protein
MICIMFDSSDILHGVKREWIYRIYQFAYPGLYRRLHCMNKTAGGGSLLKQHALSG